MKIVLALFSLATVAHAAPSGLRNLITELQLGEACDDTTPCATGLACAWDKCRTICTDDSKVCGTGEQCDLYEGEALTGSYACVESPTTPEVTTSLCNGVECATGETCAWDKCHTTCSGTPNVCGDKDCVLFGTDDKTDPFVCVEPENTTPEVTTPLCAGVECASGEICAWDECMKECTGEPDVCGDGYSCVDTDLDVASPFVCFKQLMGPGVVENFGTDPISIYKAGEGGSCASSSDCEAGLICADLKCEAVGNSN